MNLELIKAHHTRAAEAEKFWFAALRDAETTADRTDYELLWSLYGELRRRLGALIEARGGATVEEREEAARIKW